MKNSLRYVFLVAALAIIIALVNIRLEKSVHSGDIALRTIALNGQTIHVAVVDTPVARQRGLSGRQGLAGDEGMLFAFPVDGTYGFWMKDMLFPIDIVWISRDGKIVDAAENTSPDSYPQVFTPKSVARYVLELPAGYVRDHNIHIGDSVQL